MSVGAVKINQVFQKALNAQKGAEAADGAEALPQGLQELLFGNMHAVEGIPLEENGEGNSEGAQGQNPKMDFAQLLQGMQNEKGEATETKKGFFPNAKAANVFQGKAIDAQYINGEETSSELQNNIGDRKSFFTASSVALPKEEMIADGAEGSSKINIDQLLQKNDAPKVFEGHKGNFVGINQKKNGGNLYLKSADDIIENKLNAESTTEANSEVVMRPERRAIPGAYKSEAPFIQMKKGNANAFQNGEMKSGNFNSATSNLEANAISSSQLQNFKLGEMNAPLHKSGNESKVLDLSSIAKGDVNQIINRIASYIESNKLEAKGGIDLTVKHQDIGEFKIHAQRSGKLGAVDLEIVGKSDEAQRFFNQHEDKLVQALDSAGVKVGEFKLGGPGQIGSLLSSNSTTMSSTSNSSSSSFGQGNEGRSNNGQQMNNGAFNSQNGGERRRDLWKQAEDQYREFKNKAA